MSRFTIMRADGRSDARVVFDLAADAEPNAEFAHEAIASALSVGLPKPVTMQRVYASVSRANRMMLRERSRYLGTVTARGYRVLRADEHLPLALDRKSRADSLIRRGIDVLRHAELGDLSPSQRAMHQGQLMILVGIHAAVRDSTRRHNAQESAIAKLTRRVDRLDRGVEDTAGET